MKKIDKDNPVVIYGYHVVNKGEIFEAQVDWYRAPCRIWVSSVNSFEGHRKKPTPLKLLNPSREVNEAVTDKTCTWEVFCYSGVLHSGPLIGQDIILEIWVSGKAPYKLFSIEDHLERPRPT